MPKKKEGSGRTDAGITPRAGTWPRDARFAMARSKQTGATGVAGAGAWTRWGDVHAGEELHEQGSRPARTLASMAVQPRFHESRILQLIMSIDSPGEVTVATRQSSAASTPLFRRKLKPENRLHT